jgi:hypothetical protein
MRCRTGQPARSGGVSRLAVWQPPSRLGGAEPAMPAAMQQRGLGSPHRDFLEQRFDERERGGIGDGAEAGRTSLRSSLRGPEPGVRRRS